jgi:apolipoprotein N-acyltransferase
MQHAQKERGNPMRLPPTTVTAKSHALAIRNDCGKLRRVSGPWPHSLARGRYLVAVLAGLLLAASFPRIGVAGLAWVAPALMIAAALGKDGADRFRIGYVSGLAHYLLSLSWLLAIPYRWHSIPLGPAAGWLSLSAYLALYPATWVWLVAEARGAGRRDSAADAAGSGVLSASWTARSAWALSGAALWVALEMLVSRLFTGFPWNLLGSSQYRMTPLIQVASITGIYGVSFLIVWFSLSLASAGLSMLRRPNTRAIWVGEMVLPMLTVAVLFNSGFRQLRHAPPASRTLKVTLVQPSIPQTLIWDETRDDERFRELVRLSERALATPTDLLIWPEAAVPKDLRYDADTYRAVTNLAVSHHVWLIIGSDDKEPRRNSTDPDATDYFNSSFLISPDGTLVARYCKRTLVVFGEYIPLVRWLPFVKWFTPIDGGYTSGEGPVPFELADRRAKASVLICFEDIFPQLAPEYAGDDTDFLVNITNDGWFGEGAAQWQQAAGAAFRSIENGLPLVRCANTGLTCWIDAQGRMREIFRDDRGTIYGAGFMTVEVPLLARGAKRQPTFYHQHPDLFGWVCAGIGVVMLGRKIGRTAYWRRGKR